MALFKNKYRPGSIRLAHWDYGWQASYFITICTRNKIPFFGEIRNKIMGLNALGVIAHQQWIKSDDLRPDMNLKLGEFVVMPDHFHAIITIRANRFNDPVDKDKRPEAMKPLCMKSRGASNKFGPQKKNLASVVRGYKGAVTRHCRLIDPEFSWQSGFYDHVIRNPDSFLRLENYIINNPRNWGRNEWRR